MDNSKLLKDAQFRKGLGISFFNGINSAIEVVKLEGKQYTIKKVGDKKIKKEIPLMDRIFKHQAIIIERYKKYYSEVIDQVGLNFKPEDAIKKLKSTKSLETLQGVWKALSQDERHNAEILKVAQELRKEYNDKK